MASDGPQGRADLPANLVHDINTDVAKQAEEWVIAPKRNLLEQLVTETGLDKEPPGADNSGNRKKL